MTNKELKAHNSNYNAFRFNSDSISFVKHVWVLWTECIEVDMCLDFVCKIDFISQVSLWFNAIYSN